MSVHSGGPEPEPRRPLQGISDVRAFFHTNTVPLYFISPTPFNLLGIDRWIRNFFYLTYFDSFEGEHPRVFVPRRRNRMDFDSMEDVCNYLLRDPETLEFIAHRGPGGKACFVMLDEGTHALAHEVGLDVMQPAAELRHRLGSKIVMTRLAQKAGVASVPNVIGRAGSYDELVAVAHGAGLGDNLVVQAAYGDAGTTTFFLRGQRDWDRHASVLDDTLRVMLYGHGVRGTDGPILAFSSGTEYHDYFAGQLRWLAKLAVSDPAPEPWRSKDIRVWQYTGD